MTIGEFIQQNRVKQNLTQQQLADLCDLHLNAIHYIEIGLRSPKFSTVVEICKHLKIKKLDLTIFTEEK